jgi:hypothetical protein
MAFTLPDFNLAVDIYTGPFLTRVLRVSVLGNLAWGRRVAPFAEFYFGANPIAQQQMTLLLPPATDVRDIHCAGQCDLVEVPSGSGRWYVVGQVDDIGKGFPNEHRAAVVTKVSQLVDGAAFAGLFWPTPIT